MRTPEQSRFSFMEPESSKGISGKHIAKQEVVGKELVGMSRDGQIAAKIEEYIRKRGCPEGSTLDECPRCMKVRLGIKEQYHLGRNFEEVIGKCLGWAEEKLESENFSVH